MRIWTKIKRGLKLAVRREDGTATIEFVILFPALMTLFLSSFEVSVLLLRSVMLDKALDTTVRELRLGWVADPTAAGLRKQLCDRTPIVPDCMNQMMIELQPISTETWTFPADMVSCIEKSADIQPSVETNFGTANDLMIVRACAKVDPFFAPSPYLLDLVPVDGSNQYAVVAASTFVNEP